MSFRLSKSKFESIFPPGLFNILIAWLKRGLFSPLESRLINSCYLRYMLAYYGKWGKRFEPCEQDFLSNTHISLFCPVCFYQEMGQSRGRLSAKHGGPTV